MARGSIIGTIALGFCAVWTAATAEEVVPTPVAAVVAPLDAAALALKAEVEATGDAALQSHFEAQDYAPLWTEGRRAAFLEALDGVDAHGLPAGRYEPDVLRTLFREGSDAEIEVAASQVLIQYARDISSGLLEPRKLAADMSVDPPRPDNAAVLDAFRAAADPEAALAALVPSHADYARLVEERARLVTLINSGGWGAPLGGRETLRPGDLGPLVVELRGRLGRIDGVDYGDIPLFDPDLEAAVKAFQLRKGLNDDGVVGPQTRAALNASPVDRLRQVLVNLERQRWLNLDRGERHILVNQADFRVTLYDNGEATYTSRVVIGKNRHRTQEFNDRMSHMVVNPTWHVPRSIATEEMLPKLQRNPSALGGTYRVMTRNGTAVNPRYVDFRQFTAANFPFVVKQRPGGGNALGRVKFMFPNKYNIYLHDTPAKSLFNRDVRAYSHGCVRVQKPFEFAHALLAPQTEDPKGLFQQTLNTGRERRIDLDEPVPIYLTYLSVVFDEAGDAQYRGDVYGRDALVFKALSAAGVDLGLVEG
ncbi:MAG: L,D-transpeptidase family protein [Pseudomonadota bacterium]